MTSYAPTISADILTDFDFDFSADDQAAIQAKLEAAFLAAIKSMGADIPNSRMNELATQYALERAGELIGGKFDIGDATRNRVRELVAQAIDNGNSPQQLAHGLRDDIAFSRDRAQTIAVTETAAALGQAQKAAALEMDQDEKSWETSGDEGVCEECDGNAGDDWISVDDEFSSGDDTIPAHPGCRCDVIYRTRSAHEEAAVTVVEVRCPSCRRWLGRGVNAGATLHCVKCGEVRI